ncbi:Hydroxylase/desaturase asaB [Pseudocercospora fuligena]|uniref:Hydroxylase/desaturase asaB n=1 Tax=Pseudocercospora fuligena TaxID=685502 RepID=A0A8H6R8D3_9PEZI|nr:Hydroxylase/desaturase asaB [Pseudocercospora fuligena]
MEPAEILTTVNYYLPPERGGSSALYEIGTVGTRRRKKDPQTVHVQNVRLQDQKFDLDTHGFAFEKHSTTFTDWTDEEKVQKEYWPQVAAFLKELTGASAVYIFSNVLRSQSTQEVEEKLRGLPDDAPLVVQSPARFAHIDQSYTGAWWTIDNLCARDPEAVAFGVPTKTKNSRWAIINVWRPLKPVNREPLAVCDARSVREEDLQEITFSLDRTKADTGAGYTDVSTESAPKQRPSKLWEVKPNPAHKWFWPNKQEPDEVLCIKCFDSRMDGRARRAPHTAIVTPWDEGPARQSIEVRCLVFWEDQSLERDRNDQMSRL